MATAKSGTVSAPTSKDFIAQHQLGSSATVFKSINALLEKEMIYKGYTKDGTPYFEVYDVLYERWIQGLS